MPIEIIASALSAVTSGREILKWLFEHFKKNPEATAKIAEMQSLLFGLQGSLIDANDKVIKLLADLAVLKHRFDHRGKLVRRNAYYEFAEPVEGYGKGPFCLHCTDSGGFPIGVPVSSSGRFHCAHCGASGWLEGQEIPADAFASESWRDEFFNQ